MKVRLDRTICDGFGICARHAPDYFSLDDWGYASLVGNGTVPEADQSAVRRALLDCPVHAIIEMVDDDTATDKPLQVTTAGDHRPGEEQTAGDGTDAVREPQMMPGM